MRVFISVVLIRCYRLTKYLPAVLKQYSWVDKILVMNYRYPKVEVCEDDTKEICDRFNVECVQGEVEQQHIIYNVGLGMLKDYSCVFIVDADEFITAEDQQKVVELMKTTDIVYCKVIDYTDFNKSLEIRAYQPIVAVKPHIKFWEVRNAGGDHKKTNEIVMHHFGYAWKGEDFDWKCVNRWYEAFYGMSNQPSIDADCPEEIRTLIKENE